MHKGNLKEKHLSESGKEREEMNKTLIIVIDGCSSEYITEENTPNIMRMGKDGFYSKILAGVPTITNINHASIMSGQYPEYHKVVGNYFYNRETKEEGFIEASHHMKGKTIFQVYKEQGLSTALLTVKGKVLIVFGESVGIGINMQNPNEGWLKNLEMESPPEVSTLETNEWIFKACCRLIDKENPDLVYCTTNDYMMHNYGPQTDEALGVMNKIDEWIGRIYDLDPAREIYITADHGMNDKSRLIDLQKKLDKESFNTYCLMPIKDRYLENHRYQEGGAVYVHVLNEDQLLNIKSFLDGSDYVDAIYTKEEAMKSFGLADKGIGDLVVFAKKEMAFAELESEELLVNTRTHGSLYEREIPLISVNPRREAEDYCYSKDIVKFIIDDF